MLGRIILVWFLLISSAPAQQRPIKIIVPFSPGGQIDLIAREIQPILDRELNTPVLVEYKLGAGAAIGVNYVATAQTSDVLLMVLDSTLLTANVVSKNVQLDDFQFLTVLGTTSTALAVPKNSPLRDISKWGNRNINIGTNGFSGPHHYYSHLLQQSIPGTVTPVHFKGIGEAMTALLGGHIDAIWGSTATLIPYEQSGKIEFVATLSPSRIPAIEHVPTFRELGLPKMQMATIWMVVCNTSANPDIVARIQRALNKITPETHRELYERANMQPDFGQHKNIQMVLKTMEMEQLKQQPSF